MCIASDPYWICTERKETQFYDVIHLESAQKFWFVWVSMCSVDNLHLHKNPHLDPQLNPQSNPHFWAFSWCKTHKSEFFSTDIELKVEFQFFLLHLALAATGRYIDQEIFGNIWQKKVKKWKILLCRFLRTLLPTFLPSFTKIGDKNFSGGLWVKFV